MGGVYIETGLVMVLATMWFLMPITPSVQAQTPAAAPAPAPALALAPALSPSQVGKNIPCWEKITRCVNSTFNDTTLLDTIDPTFNVSHVLCCSVIQQEVKAEKECFCRGAIAISEVDSLHSDSMNEVLSICNITSPVNALCSGNFKI